MRTQFSRQGIANRALDRRLGVWQGLGRAAARPSGGWIRTIREALSMTAGELAARMGVDQSTVTRLEGSERRRSIRLDSLGRAAEAMNCDVVYALVPRIRIEDQITSQVHRRTSARLASAGHTMSLEAQEVDSDATRDLYDLVAQHIRSQPGLWREPDPT